MVGQHEYRRSKPKLFYNVIPFQRKGKEKHQQDGGQESEDVPRTKPDHQTIYPIQYRDSGCYDGGLFVPEQVRDSQPDQSSKENYGHML